MRYYSFFNSSDSRLKLFANRAFRRRHAQRAHTMTLCRSDGRGANDIRPLFVATGCVYNCLASACSEIAGGSRVVVVLKGPQHLATEPRGHRGKIQCVVHAAPFVVVGPVSGSNTFRAANAARELELLLEGVAEQVVCLESIPQLLYEVNVEVVSSEGGVALGNHHRSDLAAIVAAMMACFVHARLDVKDLVAVGTAALTADGTICVDPSASEDESAAASCTLVVGTASGEASYLSHHGNVDSSVLMELMDSACSAAVARRKEMAAALQSSQR